MEPPPHVGIDLVELRCRVSSAEVLTPSAQNRVQVPDDHPDVLHPHPFGAGQAPHFLSYPLHAACRWPALEEVDAFALLLPDRPRHPLPQVTAEEVEALLTPAQLDP